MTIQKIKNIIRKGESEKVEFKEFWRDEFLKVVSAFANTNGGSLFIGIRDDGKVTGVRNRTKLLNDLPNKMNNLMGILPKVVVWQENDLYFLEINVQPSLAPVSFRGKYYVRRGSVTIELNGYELSSLILRRYGLIWDMVIDERITDNDIDKDTVKQFISLAVDRLPSLKFETGSKLILKKLNSIDGKYYKRAALLLFGKNPQKYYP